MKTLFYTLLALVAFAAGGCLPFSYIPNQPHVTTVADKGQLEVAGKLSADPLGYGQAELHVAAAPGKRLLLTAHASAAGLEKDRHEAFIFFGNTRTYYNIKNQHLSAGAGLGTFGRWGTGSAWYAQAGASYSRVSTEYGYGYGDPDFNPDSGFVKSSGHFWVPWQQVGARFGLTKDGLWPRWSLIAALRLNQLLRQEYSYDTQVASGNPLEEPENFAPKPLHLLMQAQFGGEVRLRNGFALQATLSLSNRQNNNRLLSYGIYQVGLGASYCLGNHSAWVGPQ